MKLPCLSLSVWTGSFLVLCTTMLRAQTPSDAITMDKGVICFAAMYTHDSWDHYWEGTLKRDNGNIGTLTRQSVTGMLALGITDKINVLAALPWMKTEASAGQVTGTQGIQDAGIWVKAEPLKTRLGAGDFTIHGVLGVTFPASNYLPDYAPFSLGLGCTDGSLRGIFQYKMDKGPYLRAHAAYHLRSNCKIERDYYYTTQGYYSDEVDMPNAVTYGAILGTWLFHDTFKVEAEFGALNTLGGHDIRRQDAGFPSNKMIANRIGGGFHYYFQGVPGLGVFGNGSYVFSGRNVGQSTAFTGGVTYFFNLWK